MINAGGSLVALGSCAGIEALPPGLTIGPPPCAEGTPGLIAVLAGRSTPVLHLLNMRAIARDLGLPYDPIPLPQPGRNRTVYDPVGLFQAGR
jgi:poly-gamma-glutamate system protein